ncbi:MAG: PD40 domain-containing protein [Firmicutes bacterium]|nr:PD40 domain-containing protein [Bacillota bacterium]
MSMLFPFSRRLSRTCAARHVSKTALRRSFAAALLGALLPILAGSWAFQAMDLLAAAGVAEAAPRLAAPAAGAPEAGLPARPGMAASWFTLKGSHVTLLYPKGYEDYARATLPVAEEALAKTSSLLGQPEPANLYLVVSDNMDTFNGFTQDLAYPQVALLLPPPDILALCTAGLQADSRSLLEMLIIHEFTHAVHMETATGVTSVLRSIFGHVPLLTTPWASIDTPPTLLEGLAVWAETQLTSGGRGRSAAFNMVLRAAADSGRWPTWDQALGDYGSHDYAPQGAPYLFGWVFWDYVARHYGIQAVQRVLRHYAFYPSGDLNAAFKAVCGQEAWEIWDSASREFLQRSQEARRLLLAKQEQLSRVLQEQASAGPVPVTHQGWLTLLPAVSPDGRYLAYEYFGNNGGGLFLRDLATGRETRLTDQPFGATLSWSADGGYLLYGQAAVQGAGQVFLDLRLLDLRSGRRLPLPLAGGRRVLSAALGTPVPASVSPASSADPQARAAASSPRRLALMAFDAPSGRWQLWVALARDGGRAGTPLQADQARLVWQSSDGSYVQDLTFSPDGRRLAGTYFTGDGRQYVAVLDLERPQEGWRRVTPGTGAEGAPAWSSDGSELLFQSDAGGAFSIYSVAMAGGGSAAPAPSAGRIHQLTQAVYGDLHPSVAAGELYFMRYSAQGYDVYRQAYHPGAGMAVEAPALADSPARTEVLPTMTAPATTPPAEEAAGTSPAGPVQAQPAPYSPVAAARPRYWIPVASGSYHERLYLGVGTSGYDPLGWLNYGVSVGAAAGPDAVGSAWASASLPAVPGAVIGAFASYNAVATPPAVLGTAGTPTGILAPALTWDDTYRWQAGVAGGWTYNLNGHNAVGVQADLARGQRREQPADVGVLLPADYKGDAWTDLALVWQSQGAGKAVQWSQQTSFSAQYVLEGPSDADAGTTAMLADHSFSFAPGYARSAQVGLRLGWANRPGYWSLGGDGSLLDANPGPFSLRGFPDSFDTGDVAAKASLQIQHPLFFVERGWADQPLFLRSLDVAGFVEAGMTGETGLTGAEKGPAPGSPAAEGPAGAQGVVMHPLRASAGGEIMSSWELFYRPLTLQLGVGVAVPIAGREGPDGQVAPSFSPYLVFRLAM